MEIPAHWLASWQNYLKPLADLPRTRLVAVLQLIEAAVPEATLDWAYQMPAFKYQSKPLVYAAAYAKHTGLYALPNTHAAFAEALKDFKQGKGSVQFPHHQALPAALMLELIQFRKRNIEGEGNQ